MNLIITERQILKGLNKDLLLELIRKNIPLANMAIILGAQEVVLRREIPRLCSEYGLTYDEGRGGKGKFVSRTTPESYQVRASLSYWLLSYRHAFSPELTPREMAIAAGMTNREVLRAMNRPYDHNWTLAQMSRFSRALGMPLESLMIACTTPPGQVQPSLDLTKVVAPTNLDTTI